MDRNLQAIPNSWYVLAKSDNVKPGQILNLQLAGKNVVIFRTESGKICVSDAYCPHMGGHFGYGGKVEGENIKCPFHFFCFDTEGNCTETGYGTKPSPKLKLHVWPSEEKNGFILVYYHSQKQAPEWSVPAIDTDGWNPIITADIPLNSHPQEITENSVDVGHFTIVHGFQNVSTIKELTIEGHYLNTKYGMQRKGTLLNQAGHLNMEIDIHVFGLGYSLVEVYIPEYDLHTRQFIFPVPLESDKLSLKAGMSVKKSKRLSSFHPILKLIPFNLLNKIISKQAFKGFFHDLSQDFKIWQYKAYVTPPVLAKGDGPVMQYRNWASQFYS